MASSSSRPPGAAAAAGSGSTHESLEGLVEGVIYQAPESGFTVVALSTENGPATAVGELGEVHEGESLRLHGHWIQHPRHGRQFRADWAERATPTSRSGMERYLGSGAFPGIGPEMARRIVAHFGEGVLEALESGPERLREVPGIGATRAATISASFRNGRERHRVLAELRGFGLGAHHAEELYERWQAGAIERVRKDPWAMIESLRGVGFQTAERMARELGIPADSEARARGVILHDLREAAHAGHTCLPRERVWDHLEELGIATATVAAAAADLVSQGRLVDEASDPDSARWYLPPLWEAETGCAEEILRLLHTSLPPAATPEQASAALRRAALRPDPSQRRALELALRESFAVLTGGPGTGKTTILRLLLDTLEASGCTPVKLASPTGRAAKRLQEATGREASTLHRLLGFDPRSGEFRHDQDDPLEAAFLVVDEVSMMDLPLAHALLRAVPDGCRVLFVGDADQLPSVGPGSVLRDLVEAGPVPTARLESIHRQGGGSGIVEAAHAILHGEIPRTAARGGRGDFFLVEADDPAHVADLVERIVCERIPDRYDIDPHREVLVVAPMYRGPLGVDRLNQRLGERLNPGAPALPLDPGSGPPGDPRLRPGDRVLVIRNDYEREVFNGDAGVVAAITADGSVTVEIEGRVLTWGPDESKDLIPAWCVTVHRSQGSEARAVVVVLARSHYLMLRRNLLYTAVTRGRELVCVVAERGALRRAVRNAEEQQRYGALRKRLYSG